ncbi:MAG TPA: hypothetical protein VMZ31_12620 [Phycisphaerae bacterium]|nr:hypothetical protein [Phycisphaerae bacterium]
MKDAVLAVIGAAVLFAPLGCTTGQEPIERSLVLVMEKVVAPAVAKVDAETIARVGQVQGQGSFINPGLQTEGFGIVGTGVVWRGTIRAIGVSANIAGAAQGDRAADPPFIVQPTTQPTTQPTEDE